MQLLGWLLLIVITILCTWAAIKGFEVWEEEKQRQQAFYIQRKGKLEL